MTKDNSMSFKYEARKDSPPAPLTPATSDSDDWIRVDPTPISRVRHLNVDEVLARSLPKTVVDRDGARTKSLTT